MGDVVAHARAFAARLGAWYAEAGRDLPWRRTRDPYRILVSEIMLQQTRAATVIPYFEKFLRRYPTAGALARAPESEVLAAWSGLGYYSRARNLRSAALRIVELGRFPRAYEEIRGLPGVGPYTAAAVSSIAFDLPHAVVDGNVLRVIARLMNDSGDIGAAQVKARFSDLAQSLLDRNGPARFNQALMELGATVCLPRNPRCGDCPVSRYCAGRAEGTERELPVKLRRSVSQRIEATLLRIERGGRILLWKRAAGSSRMAGFWELPSPEQLPGARCGRVLRVFRHTITHHHYRYQVVSATAGRMPEGFSWFTSRELAALPVSTVARKALGQQSGVSSQESGPRGRSGS